MIIRDMFKKIDTLHESQVTAYREAATKSIKEWAAAFPLEPMEDGDSEQNFVDRCVSALVFVPSPTGAAPHTWPNWKLEVGKALATSEVRKRARAIFEKYRASHDVDDEDEGEVDEQGGSGAGTEDGDDSAETGDEVEGEEEEDGEEGEEEDGEVDGTTNTKPSDSNAKPQQPKNNNKGKRKTGNGKAAAVRKKGTPAKGYRNKGQSTRGGRRGGRGGAHPKKSSG